ncbi:hypothetical protein PR202_gb13442 [Eleusine coracana subsp. coracana]|uniref:Glycine-rich domain-containing protein 1 n=1 Tax=Eleusine coracana subsp. coracana TaxID=191504 RepID=A0AAV5ESN3_ELECO|nr:hypothetical protein PR202_gb13442 [Eleusine coracana subsp. coracana]
MDEEQAARWAAAQREVEVGVDLVSAARRQLLFLAEVDRRRWLYEGPLLDRAIRRYKACWLPLLAKHTEAAVVEGPLVVPLDCEWIWHCHRLNPVQYIRDCKKVYGRILDNDKVESSTQARSKPQSEKVWTELYPEEPFDLVYNSSSDTVIDVNSESAEGISYDLVAAVKRQTSFHYQVGTETTYDQRFLEEALARYKGFLYLIKMNQEKGMQLFRVPTYDVDLMWHTHQLHPVTYCNNMLKLLGKVLEHDDTDADRSEGKKLDVGFTGTTEQFESTFGVRYWKAGAMYRGNLPSPVTSTPQIFSGNEGGNAHGTICEAERHLNVIRSTFVEDGYCSDLQGKSIGVSIRCEPYGDLVLTLMVDRGSKKSEQIGKVSILMEELVGPGSKLSFERWLELKAHGGHATSPPSLRVAASSTVLTSAQQVLRMIRMEPFSLKTCLFPHSIKDQKMSIWTGFVYDFDTELIRLQLRTHKAKNGMAFFQELVGLPKSSKKEFQLAEFKENKWTLTDSKLSISNDIKSSNGDDCCILQLTGGQQTVRSLLCLSQVKLYRGRRLGYQRTCCNNHSEDASAVTAVRFSAEQPYGTAIALLDTKSQLIMVNENWFLLPWIVISFLLTEADGEDCAGLIAGTMVQKDIVSVTDTNMLSEAATVVAAGTTTAPAKCGTCGTACGSDTVVARDKAAHTSCGTCSTVAASSGGNGQRESAGCGGGCGGTCGPIVDASTKVEHAKSGGCGGGCSGGCSDMVNLSSKTGHAKSGGCGSGCGGNCGGGMVVESSKGGNVESGGCGGGCTAVIMEGSKGNFIKAGGCGSGCGSGCGGGCGGAMVIEGSKGGNVKSSGCGSGCGGGCGSGMVMEGSKGSAGKSGGCGSGCGGGCGGGGGGGCGTLIKESTMAGQSKSGGCGSGGGGCGMMFREGTIADQAKSSGCGSGCGGGGCRAMVVEGMKTSHARSAGCGSGCGGGCGSGCGGGRGAMSNA